MIKIPHMFVCMSGREGFASNRVAPQEYRLLSLRIVVDEGFFDFIVSFAPFIHAV